MKCPACGAANLAEDCRDLAYDYKGKSTTLVGVQGHFCSACGEAVLQAPESHRVSALMVAFNQQASTDE